MFDLLFLLVVGLSTAFAVLRGGLQEMGTLIALAAAAGLAWLIAPPLLGAVGLAGSFFGTVFIAAGLVAAFFVAGHVACHLGLKRMPLKGRARLYDRVGGGVFGFARGLALVGLGFLGYSYYLDEARQPESVQNAMTRPVAAGLANWFESFAPASTDLEGLGAEPAAETEANAAEDGYARADRNGLAEIVTTVTTNDAALARPALREASAAEESDDEIADILQGEQE